MYAPYLPLRERLEVDGWALVPVAERGNADYVSDFAETAAHGLVKLYDTGRGDAFGALVHRVGDGIGAGIPEGEVLTMQRALVVTVLAGNPMPPRVDDDDLTELQWWFVCFTLLRNAIGHGKGVDDDRHQHDGHWQTDLGLHRLHEAIKATVISRVGQSELTLDPLERMWYRALREHQLRRPGEPAPDVDG